MPLDSETLKAIQEAIKESLPTAVNEAIKPFSEQFEKIQHDNKKLSESVTTLTTSIPRQLDERFNNIKPSLDYLEQLKKAQETDPKDKTKPKDKIEPVDIEALRASILSEVKQEYEGKLTAVQQQLDERDKETKALREAERQTKMRNEVLNTMRGLGTVRPNTEEDLLTLLEKRGLLVEEGDRLFVKDVDKFGDVIKSEFKDILPKMLETDFAHFAVPRGGTGTDGGPGTRATPSHSQYNFEGMTAQDIYNSYSNNQEAQKALISELEKQYGKPS
jgi:phage shock protein A